MSKSNFHAVGNIHDDQSFGAKWETCPSNYPRKILRREHWQNLNGPWQFAFDDELQWNQPEQIEEFTRTIQVPFAPESELSGIADTSFHPRCWYRREFHLARRNQRAFLHFGAVDYEAHVWVNGCYVGSHRGGFTPFSFEITSALAEGPQEVLVRVDDDPQDLAKPRGKQDWQLHPHSIWYARTTGIWQTVWIEEVADVSVDRLRWTPNVDRWEIGCEAFLSGAKDGNLQLKVKLSAMGKLLAHDTYQVLQGEVHRRIALPDPGIDDFRNELLWSPERPTLIDAEIELYRDGSLVDRVTSYTAMRKVSIQRDRFMLNGRPYFQRLVLDQGYWSESLMTAPTQEALKRDVELAKAAGFNGVRKHQKIEDPDYYYWADRLGLLVWTEMPSAYRFSHESVERVTQEWMDVIDRDMNHPCIVTWVPFNESWGVPDLADKRAHQDCVQALYYLTRTLDSSRPVIGNDGWESVATDILGIHDYDAIPERLREKYGSESALLETLEKRRPGGRVLISEGYSHRGQPIMLTEFGGIKFGANAADESTSWGYSECETADDFSKRYRELLHVVNHLETLSGFCYTQLTDTFQEANGLFTMNREPKIPLPLLQIATRAGGYNRGELLSTPQPQALPLPLSAEN